MMELGAFLKDASTRPWRWGVHDCTAMPARRAGIAIPAYTTEDEACALIEDAGGLVPLWERHVLGRATEVDVDEPAADDIGIILATAAGGGTIEIGALFSGRRWMFVPLAGGIAGCLARPVKVWRPTCLKH